MQAFEFTDRTVFVAGGTGGINLGIAEAFAEAGARLAVISRSQERVDTAKRLLSRFGREALGFAADVRNVDATATALREVHRAFGVIDILVSGAAGTFPSLLSACRRTASRQWSISTFWKHSTCYGRRMHFSASLGPSLSMSQHHRQ